MPKVVETEVAQLVDHGDREKWKQNVILLEIKTPPVQDVHNNRKEYEKWVRKSRKIIEMDFRNDFQLKLCFFGWGGRAGSN